MSSNPKTSKEHFRVTGKITRLLGTESVADHVTALFEVIKNSNDADALSVEVRFYDFEKGAGKIAIKEEKGDGMTYHDIKNKFLVIGTYAKQPIDNVPQKTRRLHRSMLGQKGVGRFALEKLANNVKIISKPFGTLDKLTFSIDWKRFEPAEVTVDVVPIEINQDKRENEEDSGLEIELTNLKDEWSGSGIERLIENLKSFVLPKILQPKNAFNVWIDAPYFGVPRQLIETQLKEKAFYHLHAKLHKEKIELSAQKLGKPYLKKDLDTIDLFYVIDDKNEKKVSELTCGPAELHVYYFPTWSKGDKLRKDYYDAAQEYYGEKMFDAIPEIMAEQHGVKIYRDGLREYAYGDDGYEWTARAKITRSLAGTVQADRLVGFCLITGEGNPGIIPTTNRREAIDNQPFRDLREFVIASMLALDHKINNERDERFLEYKEKIKPTSKNLRKAESKLSNPKVSKALKQFEADLGLDLGLSELVKNARKVVDESDKTLDSAVTQNEITLANASVGDYLGRLYHDFVEPVAGGVEDSVAKLDALSRRTKIDVKELSDPVQALENRWEIMRVIFDAMDGLTKGLTAEEFYERQKARMHLKAKIDTICEDLKLLFEFADFDFVNQISPKLEIEIFGPVIYSIIYNLLSNAVKILKGQKIRHPSGNQIVVRTRFDNKYLIIIFADNSTEGIPKEKWDTVFNERISTTSKNKILPGHGLGLYIMKKMLGYQEGAIEIVEPILGGGTTFMVKLPQKVVVRN